MAATASLLGEVEIFRQNARTTDQVVRMNLEGITHEESLLQPQPAGNCLNWVFGHLLCVYNDVLPLLHQQPVWPKERLKRYGRGTPPLQNAVEANDLREMMEAWQTAIERFETGLASLTPQELDAPAPFSPNQNSNETVRSLLGLVAFHQSYHAGQTGMLRRLMGKSGAVA
jgi:uncharacterized damage-inducible protein DinB